MNLVKLNMIKTLSVKITASGKKSMYKKLSFIWAAVYHRSV